MRLILHHVIPSLIGYIIIVLILTMLPNPSSRSTIFDDELSLRRSSSSYRFTSNNKLAPSLCSICGSNNLLLHQSFCLMQSLINCFFVDPLENKMSWSPSTFWALPGYQSKFRMRNTILAPRWFVLSSTTFLPPPTQTCLDNVVNTSFLTCRWIAARPIGHILLHEMF